MRDLVLALRMFFSSSREAEKLRRREERRRWVRHERAAMNVSSCQIDYSQQISQQLATPRRAVSMRVELVDTEASKPNRGSSIYSYLLKAGTKERFHCTRQEQLWIGSHVGPMETVKFSVFEKKRIAFATCRRHCFDSMGLLVMFKR